MTTSSTTKPVTPPVKGATHYCIDVEGGGENAGLLHNEDIIIVPQEEKTVGEVIETSIRPRLLVGAICLLDADGLTVHPWKKWSEVDWPEDYVVRLRRAGYFVDDEQLLRAEEKAMQDLAARYFGSATIEKNPQVGIGAIVVRFALASRLAPHDIFPFYYHTDVGKMVVTLAVDYDDTADAVDEDAFAATPTGFFSSSSSSSYGSYSP